MISTNTLLKGLVALIVFDVTITLYAVGLAGATELNPLSEAFGLYGFMAIKILVHVAGLYIIYKHILPDSPLTARYGTFALLGIYGAVAASNVYQIAGAVA